METLHSQVYVAAHLGVTPMTVVNWVDRPSGAFPMPVARTVHDERGRRETFGWRENQLPLLREWLGNRLSLSDPAAHWALIDSGGQPPGGHQDQGALFDPEGTAQQ